jgi:para-nitrobenzyl esterase
MVRWVRLLVAAAVGLLALTAPAVASASPAGLVVATDRGLVRGQVAGATRQFLGIPYAAPPTGALRWRPPQPAATWAGVRDATHFGSICPQPGGLGGSGGGGSEDCLFLNVYTPAHGGSERDLPVMFWIHGGALVTGAGSFYDPSELVAHGVVVVTINYRLGALGFLAHPAFSAESAYGGSGDYGLMDQVAALRWTRRNIDRFGGDAGNVTIFGESAGGLSVHSQLVSPLSRGLFAKAITESGAYSLVQDSLAQAEAAGTGFATSVGCAGQEAACLRGVPAATLVAHEGGGYTPNLDGHTLVESVGPALASGRFHRVPVIEGTNHDEWRLFVASAELARGRPLAPSEYVAGIEQTLPRISPAQAQTLATVDYPLSAYGGNPSLALGALGTDAIFACNARTVLKSASRFVRSFQYEFNDEAAPSLLPAVSFPQGAEHAVELQYLFAGVGLGPQTPGQKALSRDMMAYWTQFAKTGQPNSGNVPSWPRFSSSTERFQSLVPPAPVTATGFATEHKCALWGG